MIIYFKIILLFVLSFSSPLALADSLRLVSLKPNITEVIHDLGLGNNLVGVTSYCHISSGKKLDRIADYVHVDVERVMALRPSIVLGSEENSSKKELHFLKARGIRVELFPFRTLAETRESILKIASLFGKVADGQKQVAEMDAGLDRLKGRGVGEKVLIVVGTNPLVVAGERTLLSDLLKRMGGRNAAGASKLRYPAFSLEQLVASNPDVIVNLSMGTERGEDRELFRRFPSLAAVKNNRIYFLDMNHFPASPGMVRGAEELAEVLAVIPAKAGIQVPP